MQPGSPGSMHHRLLGLADLDAGTYQGHVTKPSISSMNGRTRTGETILVTGFQVMPRYAQARHLARFAFWSVNRDRPCAPGSPRTRAAASLRERTPSPGSLPGTAG